MKKALTLVALAVIAVVAVPGTGAATGTGLPTAPRRV